MGKLRKKYRSMPVQVKASLWFLICSFLQKGISTVSTPIFTRLLSTAEYGQYNVFNSWLGIITIFVTLNLSAGVYTQGLVKFDKDNKILSSSLQGLTLFSVVVWTVVYLLFRNFWNRIFLLTTVQMLAMLAMIWTTAVFSFWASEQRVEYKYRTLVIVTLLVSLAKPIIGVIFVINADDKVTARILGLVLAELIGYTWTFFDQIKKGKRLYSKKYWLYALGFNLPLVPHYLSQVVLSSADRIMIRDMISADAAGIYIINSKLMNRLKKKLEKLRGYHPETGEMNQEAFFACSDYITNSISIPRLFRNMQNAADFMASKGIGCVHSVSGVGFIGNLDISMEQAFAKSLRNGMQVRIFPQSMDVKVATSRKLPRIGGCFQCALDGCFGSQDASLNEPYTDGSSGVLYYTDEQVIDFCKRANRAGLQIEMHAIGDKAFDQACRAIKAALDDYPRENHRHGIIHDCLPTEEGVKICRDYHIQMPVQSAFINWKQEPDEYLEAILGKERAEKLNPLGTFVRNGIIISDGSDAPCTTPNPIAWIDKAVNHPVHGEAISVQDALRMCTYNGYYASFDEDKRGSLEVGKFADMVILSENPYEVEKTDLKNIKVEQLLLQGLPYRSCRENIFKAALRGLHSRDA